MDWLALYSIAIILCTTACMLQSKTNKVNKIVGTIIMLPIVIFFYKYIF